MLQEGAFWLKKAFKSPLALGLTASALGVAGMCSAIWVQHSLGMDPCPLCIFQRVAMIWAALAGLAGAVASRARWRWAARGLWAIGAAGAIVGMGMAARHMHVVWWPPEASCGPDLEYLMDAFPPTKWIPSVFAGEAECSAAGSELVAGLPIPIWAAVAFAAQAAALLRAWRLSRA